MGFRFHRRIKLLPGVSLNVGKKSASISIGKKGAKLTMGTKGKHLTFGIPGTGLYYTEKLDKKQKKQTQRIYYPKIVVKNTSSISTISTNNYNLNSLPNINSNLLSGILAYNKKDYDLAIQYLQQDSTLEASLLLAMIYYLKKDFSKAKSLLEFIINHPNKDKLGNSFQELKINPTIGFFITNEIFVQTKLDLIVALLILTEIYQIEENLEFALKTLNQAYNLSPHDNMILLSLIEIIYEYYKKTKANELLNNILSLTENITLKNLIDAGILYYRLLVHIEFNQIKEAKLIYQKLSSHSSYLSAELANAMNKIKQRMDKLVEKNISFKEIK